MTVPDSGDDGLLIGVAVAVPAPLDEHLRRCRSDFGDPLADSIAPHVTLLPPTRIEDAALTGVQDHLRAAAARVPAFGMRLRGTRSFRPVSPVVYLCIDDGEQGCRALEQAVRSGPLRRELAFAYHPHVTVAHDVAEPALDRAVEELSDYDESFDVTSFGLYRQGDDGVWQTVQTYRLGVP